MAKWKHQWHVDSRSTPGKTYTVSEAFDGTFACSCLAWTRMRKECTHIKMVREDLERGRMRAAIVPLGATDGDAVSSFNEFVKNLETAGDEQPSKPIATSAATKPAKPLSLLEQLATDAPWRIK